MNRGPNSQLGAHGDPRDSNGNSTQPPPLRIAAFNIRIFGRKKMGDKNVVETLKSILHRYDLILVQEIRDSSQTALDELVEACSKIDPDNPFDVAVSERLGRGHCKEQYAFMYRTNRLSVADEYQYDDGEDNGSDKFMREPYAVRFKSPTTDMEDFAIIAIHTSPDAAAEEVGALHKVHDVTEKHWNMKDILIAGDFNADGNYVDEDDWQNIALKTDQQFKWLIKDEADTTVGRTHVAYDRFVVTGEKFRKTIIPEGTKVYRFDEDLGLSKEEAMKVSDHYPIEMEIWGKVQVPVLADPPAFSVPCETRQSMDSSLCFVLYQKTPVANVSNVRKIYRAKEGPKSAHFRSRVNYDDSSMYEVVATRDGVSDVITALREFQKAFPDVLEDETIERTQVYMDSQIMSKSPVAYGLISDSTVDEYTVTVIAKLDEPLHCSVTVARKI